MTLKGYFGLAILAALAILIAATTVQTGRANKFKALDTQHRACVAALSPKAIPGADLATLCDPLIAAAHDRAAQADGCDQSLTADNAYGVAARCSGPVKTLGAQRDAARSDLADLTAQLALEKQTRAGAIARAAADAKTETERKARAAQALARAPRDDAGRVICDADCMRDRWGQGPAVADRP